MKVWWLLSTALGVMACASGERASTTALARVVTARCGDDSFIAIETRAYGGEPISEEVLEELVARECLTREFDTFVKQRRECETDQECVRVDTWCPFPPGVAVAAKHAEAVKERYREVSTEYAKFSSCKYKASLLENAVCRDHRCALDDSASRRRRRAD